jgi:hypothetical protein
MLSYMRTTKKNQTMRPLRPANDNLRDAKNMGGPMVVFSDSASLANSRLDRCDRLLRAILGVPRSFILWV